MTKRDRALAAQQARGLIRNAGYAKAVAEVDKRLDVALFSGIGLGPRHLRVDFLWEVQSILRALAPREVAP
jgi:hypothetical protein